MPQTLNREPLRDQIRDFLLERIGNGTLNAGDRVVEARVCEELGVSSIPVREALRELVTMGVLSAATHKGAWVREVSLQETTEALEVKAVLEALAARLATPKFKGNCAVLRQICAGIVEAACQNNLVAFQQRNQVFHRCIVETAGNAALLRIWSSLAFEVRTRFIMDFVANGDAPSIASEHEPIVEAFESGDSTRAADLLARHASDLIAYLREHGAAPVQTASARANSSKSARKKPTRTR